MNIELKLGDCIEVLKTLPDNSVDSIVTDPPYGIGFMNKEWDSPTKLKEQQEKDLERAKKRGKVEAKFSPFPGQGWGGAKEAKWFQEWCELWAAECLRVLKPGGYILSFSAPRTYHRMTTAFEDVGFEIRDQLMWLFGSGFPKSLNIGKAIDKLEGNERETIGQYQRPDGTKRNYENFNETNGVTSFNSDKYSKQGRPISIGDTEWEGWGTALKPAHEPIVMARKPLSEKTNAENVLKWGTGALNIDGSRIGTDDIKTNGWGDKGFVAGENYEGGIHQGRFPSNVLIDEEAGKMIDEQSGIGKGQKKPRVQKGTVDYTNDTWGLKVKDGHISPTYDDMGGASRFFYCAKVSGKERNMGCDDLGDKTSQLNSGGIGRKTSVEKRLESNGENAPTRKNFHPTVKPIKLMEYLIKLVTRKGGVVLDPFLGSGSTGMAAVKNGYNFIGIEKEQDYMVIAEKRIHYIKNENTQLKLFDDARE